MANMCKCIQCVCVSIYKYIYIYFKQALGKEIDNEPVVSEEQNQQNDLGFDKQEMNLLFQSSVMLFPTAAKIHHLVRDLITASCTGRPRAGLLHIRNHRWIDRMALMWLSILSLEINVILTLVFYPSGKPKGAMLTHGNIISNTAAFLKTTEVNQHANVR